MYVLWDVVVLVGEPPMAEHQRRQRQPLGQVLLQHAIEARLSVQPHAATTPHQVVPQEVCPGRPILRVQGLESLNLSRSAFGCDYVAHHVVVDEDDCPVGAAFLETLPMLFVPIVQSLIRWRGYVDVLRESAPGEPNLVGNVCRTVTGIYFIIFRRSGFGCCSRRGFRCSFRCSGFGCSGFGCCSRRGCGLLCSGTACWGSGLLCSGCLCSGFGRCSRGGCCCSPRSCCVPCLGGSFHCSRQALHHAEPLDGAIRDCCRQLFMLFNAKRHALAKAHESFQKVAVVLVGVVIRSPELLDPTNPKVVAHDVAPLHVLHGSHERLFGDLRHTTEELPTLFRGAPPRSR